MIAMPPEEIEEAINKYRSTVNDIFKKNEIEINGL